MNAPLPPEAVAVAQLPIAEITPSPSNPRKRFDDAYLAELADSIKAHGLIQPITVRPMSVEMKMAHNARHTSRGDDYIGPPTYEIVVGECRWRAAQIAGLTAIPAFWRELDDKQVLEIQVIENLQRRDVHPIEEAEGYDQLMQWHGYKAEEIAAKIGKSRAYVYARLKLTALCPAARDAAFAGKLDASTALLVARIPGEALQKRAVKEITEGYTGEPLSYRAAVSHIRGHFTISLQQATFPLADAALVPAAGSCEACPKRSGNAPELCADLADADVCTDTKCFDEKRLARRAQLIAKAEKLKIPVITGDEAWQAVRNEARVGLDDKVEGDGQERTYRQILGDQAPKPVALAEVGHGERKRMVELADTTAMEKALKKAGWTPDLFKEPEDPAEAKRRREEEAAHQAEREAKKAAQEAENAWRKTLRTALAKHLHESDEINTDHAIVGLAIAWLHHETHYAYDLPDDLLAEWSIEIPAEYNADDELPKICAAIAKWPIQKALAFLFTALTEHDEKPAFGFDPETDKPLATLAVAQAVGFDVAALRNPAPTPTQAAQAQGEGATKPAAPAKTKGGAKAKKTESKSNPAPALPANEPATPVKTPGKLPPAKAWPFPAGNRPAKTTGTSQ